MFALIGTSSDGSTMPQRAARCLLPVLLLLLSGASSAQAQWVCASREAAVDRLTETHHEVVRGGGLSAKGYVVELYVSDSGSWTVLVTLPSMVSCIDDFGEAWSNLPKPVSDSDQDAPTS